MYAGIICPSLNRGAPITQLNSAAALSNSISAGGWGISHPFLLLSHMNSHYIHDSIRQSEKYTNKPVSFCLMLHCFNASSGLMDQPNCDSGLHMGQLALTGPSCSLAQIRPIELCILRVFIRMGDPLE